MRGHRISDAPPDDRLSVANEIGRTSRRRQAPSEQSQAFAYNAFAPNEETVRLP